MYIYKNTCTFNILRGTHTHAYYTRTLIHAHLHIANQEQEIDHFKSLLETTSEN